MTTLIILGTKLQSINQSTCRSSQDPCIPYIYHTSDTSTFFRLHISPLLHHTHSRQRIMEFHAHTTHQPPKNLYPCLATITIHPNPSTFNQSRRLSTGSAGGDDANPLQRVISGNRRKTSFGDASHTGIGERRKSIVSANANTEDGSGKWYWRVQVGVSDVSLSSALLS
jgi:hypothetical protein